MTLKAKKAWLLVGCVALPLLAGGVGALVTTQNIATWYAGLNKPDFTPPDWVFGPVWTALYVMMGLASYLVLRRGVAQARVHRAGIAYGVQLGLNAAWTPVFFGLHLLWVALMIIVALWVAIFVTMVLFKPISKRAALLMFPYLAWVSYAAALNLAIAYLNR